MIFQLPYIAEFFFKCVLPFHNYSVNVEKNVNMQTDSTKLTKQGSLKVSVQQNVHKAGERTLGDTSA